MKHKLASLFRVPLLTTSIEYEVTPGVTKAIEFRLACVNKLNVAFIV